MKKNLMVIYFGSEKATKCYLVIVDQSYTGPQYSPLRRSMPTILVWEIDVIHNLGVLHEKLFFDPVARK